MSIIVLGFTNFNESPIEKFSTTLELMDVHIKGSPFLNSRPLNLVTYDLLNVGYNINCIITYYIIIPIPQECVIHDYVVMFHVHDELEQLLVGVQLNWSPYYKVNFVNGFHMVNIGGDH
jgi:hypothetical protein